VPDPFVDDLLERMEPLGALRARKMFGGSGLYCDGVFFALVADGVLYFKVDEGNLADFERAGMARFQPFPERSGASMGYYEVPLEVQERPERLVEWARKALEAAQRRDVSKRKSARKRKATSDPDAVPVRKLANLGPKTARWLEEVGIQTRADLERAGSVRVFKKLRAGGFEPSLNVLWALEAALLGVRGDRLPAEVRERLRRQVGRSAR
jgi:DNA transformation protein and related proteins